MEATLVYDDEWGNPVVTPFASMNVCVEEAQSHIAAGLRVWHILDRFGVVNTAYNAAGQPLVAEALAAYATEVSGG